MSAGGMFRAVSSVRVIPLALGLALALGCGGPPGASTASAPGPSGAPAAPAPERTRSAAPSSGPVDSPPLPPVAASGALAPPPSATAPPPPAVSAVAAAPPAGAPPLPRGTKVLHIGDSFAGALGQELNRGLEERGVKGVLRFKTASFIPEWAWKPDLGVLMAEHKPDLVLITLGANEVQIGDPSSRAATVERLVKRLGETPCLWVGIPLWKAGDTGLLPVIREHCAPCRYLDSNALIRDMPRLDDHIHPTMGARRRWAAWLIDWLGAARDLQGPQPWALLPQEQLPRTPLLDFGAAAP